MLDDGPAFERASFCLVFSRVGLSAGDVSELDGEDGIEEQEAEVQDDDACECP
jgi:hypothetical protein